MAMSSESSSKKIWGVIFILLIVGHDCARVEELTRTMNENARLKAVQHNAAQDRAQKRQQHGVTAESLMEEIVARDAGWKRSSGQGGEVARGKLGHFKYSKTDPSCFWPKGCYSEVFAVLSQDNGEAGAATMNLYKDLDEAHFVAGDKVDSQAHHSYKLSSDSFAGVVKSLGSEKLPGLKLRVMEDGGAYKTHFLRMVPGEDWIRVAKTGPDSDEFQTIDYSAHPSQLTDVWLGVLKTTQALGTSMTAGTSFLQCQYIPEKRECSTPEFCTLTKGTKKGMFTSGGDGKCTPKVGGAANLEAWKQFVQRATEDAAQIQEKSCMLGCRKKWKQTMQDLQLVESISKKLGNVKKKDVKNLVQGMGQVVDEIHNSAPTLSKTLIDNLSAAFDANRKQTSSPLRLFLWKKGCSNLPDGAIASIFRNKLGMESEDGTDAEKELQSYLDICPFLSQLATTDRQETMAKLSEEDEKSDQIEAKLEAQGAKIPEQEAEIKVDESKLPSDFDVSTEIDTLESTLGAAAEGNEAASLLQTTEALEPLTLIFIIVSVALLVMGLLFWMLSDFACKTRIKGQHTEAELCKAKERSESCKMWLNNIGTVLVVVGAISLIVCVIVAAAQAQEKGGGGSSGSSSSSSSSSSSVENTNYYYYDTHYYCYTCYGGYYGGYGMWYQPPYYRSYGYSDGRRRRASNDPRRRRTAVKAAEIKAVVHNPDQLHDAETFDFKSYCLEL
eukprot:TRINITY_DN990_c0_g1_i4.p1 TRINITY_DN990_c0_g1~~TRINITY_DN990_c0_g1_i4.p1  ORF type:complete len:725 (-),score=126.54 TRINITY_DN990_c0_g1_i4:200-2374(-)